MKLNQKLVAGGAAAVIAILGLGSAAMAATNTDSTNPQDSLVQKLADKFHLNKPDVQAVFDQNHQDMKQKRQAMLKARLDQAVKDGKLTADQETKLLAEIQTLHDQNKADKKGDRKEMHDHLEQWAKDNGIDLSQVLPHPDGPRGHHGDQ